jgi:hypothetical protein
MLFADADEELIRSCKAATGHYATAMANKMHLLTAQGLFDELATQLNDPKSMLRSAGSAFGILAGLGTSLRIVERRLVESSELIDNMALGSAYGETDNENRYESLDSMPLSAKVEQQLQQSKTPMTLQSCGIHSKQPVPRISNFPGDWCRTPLSWWIACVPESCRSGCTKPRIKAAIFCESKCTPELQQRCEPTHLCAVSPAEVAACHEAGSGGWPLCVPQSFVAFRPSSSQRKQIDAKAYGQNTTQLDPKLDVQAPIFQQAFLQGEEGQSRPAFHPISLEADDEEVTLLILSSSITDHLSLPTWLNSTRVVIPRGSVSYSKQWSPGDVIDNWPKEWYRNGNQLFRNWVELECTPMNSQSPLSVLIALPHADLAQRFHEACRGTPRPPKPIYTREAIASTREAVICELQLLASIDVFKESQAHNCGTSMRRSICEAMGIHRNRVQVLSVQEGGGSILGWAAAHLSGLQKAIQSSAVRNPNEPFVPDV